MNVSTFLKHWSIRENPFMAEEARQDDVLARLDGHSSHPDLPKIRGDLSRPASSVVFGEKGSGKTAIRLRLETDIRTHNKSHADQKVLTVAYDELNPVLDRFARRVKGRSTIEALEQLRLVDHIDGILSVAIPDLVDAALGRVSEGHVELGSEAPRLIRRMDRATREDWLILQALYDRPDQAIERGRRLRHALRERRMAWARPLRKLAVLLWILLLIASSAYAWFHWKELDLPTAVGLSSLCVLTLLVSIQVLVDRYQLSHLSRQVSGQIKVLDRSADSLRASLERLPREMLTSASLPVDDLDDPRYAMIERLRRAVAPFGFTKIIVLIDRVDEPTLVSGETALMKAVVWPLFNNKFLQQDHVAFKMMLPLELRHELFRQSGEFFQEARLDKQNMIDRLTWSGTTLYDLCSARVNACLDDGSENVPLTQLFDDSVNRQDIVDALDQMRQPRDAFKMMYQVIQEHCSTVTEEDAAWRIPKLVLDQVRRQQADRIEGLHRGLRPS